MLSFSANFVISGLFGDVKTEKIGSFCVTGRSNIATIFSEHKNLPHFLAKKRCCLYLKKKMLEGLHNIIVGVCDHVTRSGVNVTLVAVVAVPIMKWAVV